MAIAPIDLQTLFTQLDKVGKAQAFEREGQAIQQSLHGVQIQRKTEEQIHQVNEAQDSGDGADKIRDRSDDGKENKSGGRRSGKGEDETDENDRDTGGTFVMLRDPNLGNKIDISM